MRYVPIISLFIIASIYSCDENPYKQGAILYENFCASCHMDDGSGLLGNIPPLAQSDYLVKHQEELACIIRYGQQGEIVVNGKKYNNPMPGIPQLTDFEIANIINYINHAWGNDLGFYQIDEVRANLEQCE
jgi:mono/diheme cytochrome c family protein